MWIPARPWLNSLLLDRLHDNASDGICPDCFDRVCREAERQRAERDR
jgi:hypothetical protein